MKIRHFKRRARRPDFVRTLYGSTVLIEVKSAAAVERFFATTPEEDERAMEFFGCDAVHANR
jgi:hypothetical protein